jgi:transcriptional regulator with XRE-family HTH domain
MGRKADIDEQVTGSARTLAVNLRALMAATPELGSNPKLGAKTKLGVSAISRLVNGHNATIETLDRLAEAFQLQVWQLLMPGLDPKNLPVVQPVTQKERELYERFKEVAKELVKET